MIKKHKAADTCMISMELGDQVQRLEDGRIGTLVAMKLAPNGTNSPELVCIVKVRFPEGREMICTSDKFRPAPDWLYQEFYSSLL